MKFESGTLLVIILMMPFRSLCEAILESASHLKNSARYDVVVIRTIEETKDRLYSPGVIISERYVLSYDFGSLPTQNVKLVVDITVIGAFSNGRAKNYDSDNFIGNATEYEVGKHWQFDSLSLYQTKIPIAFTNNKVRSINLPKGKELNEWKDPYKIPNNSDFSVIYWCRPSAENNYSVEIITHKRECDDNICYRWTNSVSSCMKVKIGDKICQLYRGGPLVFKDTLVGIRKSYQRIDPLKTNTDDIFINVALYTEMIEKIMKNELKSTC